MAELRDDRLLINFPQKRRNRTLHAVHSLRPRCLVSCYVIVPLSLRYRTSPAAMPYPDGSKRYNTNV